MAAAITEPWSTMQHEPGRGTHQPAEDAIAAAHSSRSTRYVLEHDHIEGFYNHERPHEARSDATGEPLQPLAAPEAAVRRARTNGTIKWQGDLVHISDTLIGKVIAVEETEQGDRQARVFDGPIGRIDPVKRKLRRQSPPMSPLHPVRSVTRQSAGQGLDDAEFGSGIKSNRLSTADERPLAARRRTEAAQNALDGSRSAGPR